MDEVNMRICRRLAEENVIYCVSGLVDVLYNRTDLADELVDALFVPDYVGACESEEIDIYYNSAMEKYVFRDREGNESEVFDTYQQACEAAVMHYDLDYECREALEHWLVTRSFGEQLKEHGEMVVFNVLALEAIWGRGCSGQAIYLDGVIEKIAEDMEILVGQKHDWSRKTGVV
jgi:hypothetical protein